MKSKTTQTETPDNFHKGRLQLIFIVVFTTLFAISVRSLFLTVFPPRKEGISKIAHRQYLDKIDVPSLRVDISDRNGMPLATSTLKTSVAINPRTFRTGTKQLKSFSEDYGIRRKDWKNARSKKGYFAWVKRHTSKSFQSKTPELPRGLFLVPEPARYYPVGEAAATVVGFVGKDNDGLVGIERFANQGLKSNRLELGTEKDAKGNPLVSIVSDTDLNPISTNKVFQLTIDSVIQQLSFEALKTGVKDAGAKRGFAVVMQPHTGDLLAIANYPSFNPNLSYLESLDRSKNLAFTMQFEPGSVVKPFVIGTALEKRLIAPTQTFDCEKNGRFKVSPRNWISDDHPKENLDTKGVLVHSSNICTFKIAKKIGPESLWKTYVDIGFAKKADSMLPSTSGSLSDYKGWSPIRFANIAFGQGHAVNGIQIARAFAVLANGGHAIPDRLNFHQKQPQQLKRKQIYSPGTARLVREMLAGVVEEGTGSLAKTNNYPTAGKTGTAEKFDLNLRAYSKDKRVVSFAGFSPVEAPRIVVVVVIDEPSNRPFYGGTWAAPIFSKIVEGSLRYLDANSKYSAVPKAAKTLH